MFKDSNEGKTHSYNDGCGELAHNQPQMDISKLPKGLLFNGEEMRQRTAVIGVRPTQKN